MPGLHPIEARAALNELIAAHVKAQVALSWAGGGDPADLLALELDAKEAEEAIRTFIYGPDTRGA